MTTPKAPVAGARVVAAGGYADCVELSNARTRVLLQRHLGGRVLSYALDGIEALQQDERQRGLIWDGTNQPRHPAGGRCDIGPEYGGVTRDGLWFGSWAAEITGARSARLVSPVLADSGVQLVREFQLDETSSQLSFRQVMCNRGSAPVQLFHWGRTFLPAGGVALAPLPVRGRFPRSYALGGPAGMIDFMPVAEPAVRIREGVLEILESPSRAKVIFDVQPGWLAYLAPTGLLFAKTFSVYPDRPYGELAANNACIWYGGPASVPNWPGAQHVVEIEPIGPWELLPPGAEAEFAEHWHLEPWSRPTDQPVDLAALRAWVEARASGA